MQLPGLPAAPPFDAAQLRMLTFPARAPLYKHASKYALRSCMLTHSASLLGHFCWAMLIHTCLSSPSSCLIMRASPRSAADSFASNCKQANCQSIAQSSLFNPPQWIGTRTQPATQGLVRSHPHLACRNVSRSQGLSPRWVPPGGPPPRGGSCRKLPTWQPRPPLPLRMSPSPPPARLNHTPPLLPPLSWCV